MKMIRSSPFPLNERFVKMSAFRGNMKTVRSALCDWKKGVSIGFTREQSLKSMGLIPRRHGGYELGNKYNDIFQTYLKK